jgi:4-amino-4-deoxy-L-arabinose transferase-like glycosyltransferase
MNRKLIVSFICILGVIFSIILSWVYFRFSYFEPDTTSYLFQAKIFAKGKLCYDAPSEFGFSSSPHINILNGKWYSKYPFGNALMLMFGVFFNAPWIIPAIATGLSLLLLYLIVRETYGTNIALIAIILGLISPTTLGMSSNWFSESVSRFYLAIYVLGLILTLKSIKSLTKENTEFPLEKGDRGIFYLIKVWFSSTLKSKVPQWIYPLLSGFALGYAFNTRPMPAVAFGVAGAGLAIYWMIRYCKDTSFFVFLRRMSMFLLPFAFMIVLCMAWNFYFTGNPLKFTHNAAQPYDKLGFGKRAEGYEPDLDNAFVFTPQWAVERIWRHTIPCISFNTLGWGYYRPNLFRSYRENQEPFLTLRVIPLAFPLIFMLIPLFHPSRNRYDVFFFSFLILNMALYFFFYFEGSTWGVTPVNARYYTECTLLGIIPLVARGMFITYNWIRKIPTKIPVVIIALLLAILTVNTVYTYIYIGKPYQNWGAVYQQLPRIVKQQNIHNAVIFVPYTRDAPLSDYPFKSLSEADIVYFRLGPSKVWRLNNSDWRSVYNQYFKGRQAYIYENGKLKQLP